MKWVKGLTGFLGKQGYLLLTIVLSVDWFPR